MKTYIASPVPGFLQPVCPVTELMQNDNLGYAQF